MTLFQALSIAVTALPFMVAVGGVVVVFLVGCHGAGRLLVAGPSVSLGDRLVLATPIGTVVLGMAAFLLAAIGQLSVLSFGVVGLVFLGLAHRRCFEDFRDVRGRLRTLWRDRSRSSFTAPVCAAAVFLISAAGLLLHGLYPRLGFDETLYHLPFTRAMLETGELPFLAHLRYPVFPNLQEALWVPLLATLGQSGPSALVSAQTAWVGLLLGYWVGGRLGLGAGLLAASLWLGCPIGWWTGTQAMVDVALALYATMAAVCLDRWETSRKSRWLVLAGIAVGGGAATKYHGLLVLGLVCAALLLGSGIKRRLAALAPLLASAALVALPVYGWITVTTANPLFPFASGTFGASEWSQYTRQTGGPESASGAGMATVLSVRLNGLLQSLDDVPETIDQLAIPDYEEGPPAPLSVWLVLLAPVGLLAIFKPWRRARRWAAVFLIYFAVWFSSAQDPRYLFSALPLLIPLYAAGLATFLRLESRHRRADAVAVGISLLLLLPGFIFAAVELARLGALPTSGLAREAFLHDHRPGYTALRSAEAELAARATDGRALKIFTLFGADLQYFALAPLHGDWYGPDRFSRFGDFRMPEVVQRWRDEGFEYVLEVHRRTPPTVGWYPDLLLVHKDKLSTLWQIAPLASDEEPGNGAEADGGENSQADHEE